MSNSKIGRNAIANIAGTVVQLAIAFVISPFLVHSLGDTKYGIWTIAAAFTGYMNLLDLGLTSAINYYTARYNGRRDVEGINVIASTALVVFLALGSLIALVSPAMADLVVNLIKLDGEATNLIHLLIIVVSFDVGIVIVSGVFLGVFGGLQRYSVINYVQIGAALYKSVMFYLFISHGFDLIAMGAISISANLLAVVALYIALKREQPSFSFGMRLFNKTSASKLFRYSKFTFVAMAANQLIYYSDAFVIGFFMSAAAVTYYSIPWTLAEYSKRILLAISKTYSPAVSELQSRGVDQEVIDIYLSGSRYLILISNLLSLGVVILGGAFIAMWMGPKYRDLGEAVLLVLFANQFVMGPQHISYAVLKGLAKQKQYSYVSILVSVFNLMLSIILIQHWGILGVAVGAAVPQIIFHGLYVPTLTLRALGLSPWVYFKSTYSRTIVPTAILLVSLLAIRALHYPTNYFELLSAAFFAAFLYLLSAYYLSLDKSERDYVRQKLSFALS